MTIYTDEKGFYINKDVFEQTGTNEILVRFQAGIHKEELRNGIDVDDLIELALLRVKHYNSIVPCRENSIIITKLEESLHWIDHRKKDREKRGVSGTNQK